MITLVLLLILLLAIGWEMVARLELVSTTALPPLSEVIVAWIDMIKTGELVTNGLACSTAPAPAWRCRSPRRRARHRHGLVEAGERAGRADREMFIRCRNRR
jgi:hypothetical protein